MNSTAKIEAITHAMASMYDGEQKEFALEKAKKAAFSSMMRNDGGW